MKVFLLGTFVVALAEKGRMDEVSLGSFAKEQRKLFKRLKPETTCLATFEIEKTGG